MSIVEASGPILHAPIAASNGGGNELVEGVEGKLVRVLAYTLVSAGTVTAKFRSGVSTDLTGGMPLAANSVVSGAFNPCGHFETADGEALDLPLSDGIAVGGHLTYQLVPA